MLSLENALGLADPALVTRWFVNFPEIINPFDVVAETIEIPFPKAGSRSRLGQGQQVYFPDVEDIDAVSLGVYETHDFKALRYFEQWYNKVKDERGNYGVPVDYKKIFWAHLYRRDRNEPVVTVEFSGAWPTDRSGFSFNYEDSAGRVIKQVQLQIDRMKIKTR